MANKDTFTSDEWTLLRIAPSFVSVGISAVDPSGLFSSVKEVVAGANRTMATLLFPVTIEVSVAQMTYGMMPLAFDMLAPTFSLMMVEGTSKW